MPTSRTNRTIVRGLRMIATDKSATAKLRMEAIRQLIALEGESKGRWMGKINPSPQKATNAKTAKLKELAIKLGEGIESKDRPPLEDQASRKFAA